VSIKILNCRVVRPAAGRVKDHFAFAQDGSLNRSRMGAHVMDHDEAIRVKDQVMLHAAKRKIAVEFDSVIVPQRCSAKAPRRR
jgi:hypothetical protein